METPSQVLAGKIVKRLVAEGLVTAVDPQAGWPRNAKSGRYWATSGETRRLHPLQKPS
jgi:hypothetical protein